MKKKRLPLLVGLLILVVSIGFAWMSSTVGIGSIFTISATKVDVHFANIKIIGGVNSTNVVKKPVIVKDDNNKDTKINYGVNLDKPGDYYEFNVDVVNDGNVDVMLDSIDYGDENEYIDVVLNYSDGTPFNIKDGIKAGKKITLDVKVIYSSEVTEIPDEELNFEDLTLTVNFVIADDTVNYNIDTTKNASRVEIIGRSTTIRRDDIIDYIGMIKVFNEEGQNITEQCDIEFIFNTPYMTNDDVYVSNGYIELNVPVSADNYLYSFYAIVTDPNGNTKTTEYETFSVEVMEVPDAGVIANIYFEEDYDLRVTGYTSGSFPILLGKVHAIADGPDNIEIGMFSLDASVTVESDEMINGVATIDEDGYVYLTSGEFIDEYINVDLNFTVNNPYRDQHFEFTGYVGFHF